MERRTVLGRLNWQLADVIDIQMETARVKSLVLAVPDWIGHQPGQHVDVRLTAEDGYQAQRSYSIASPPEDTGHIVLTIERLEDGEVSPYLVDELRSGDKLELRGPIGGYFVWEASMGGPLLLVAGGSGIVPLMAMIRHRQKAGSHVATRLIYSSRFYDDIIYRDELDSLASEDRMLEVVHTLTRTRPPGWTGYHRRIDAGLLNESAWPSEQRPLAFTCGPTQFVETVAAGLLTLEYEPSRIKTERFGPSGGS